MPSDDDRPPKPHRPAFGKTEHRARDCPTCGKQVRAERVAANTPVYLLLMAVWFGLGAVLVAPIVGTVAALLWFGYWVWDADRAKGSGWVCPTCGSQCAAPAVSSS